MADKKNQPQNEEELQVLEEAFEDELDLMADVPSSEIVRFGQYASLFEHPQIKEIIPDFYNGRDLVGTILAIWSWEWKESRAFGDFIVAEVELPNDTEKIRVAFFSLPVKTIFRGLEGKNVPKPFVVALERTNQTYTFTNPRDFLAKRNR